MYIYIYIYCGEWKNPPPPSRPKAQMLVEPQGINWAIHPVFIKGPNEVIRIEGKVRGYPEQPEEGRSLCKSYLWREQQDKWSQTISEAKCMGNPTFYFQGVP